MKEIIVPTKVNLNKYKTINKTFYVSEDNLKQSDNKQYIEQYEKEVEKMKQKTEKFKSLRKLLYFGNDKPLYIYETNYFKLEDKKDLKFLLEGFYHCSSSSHYTSYFKKGWVSIKLEDDEYSNLIIEYASEIIKDLKIKYNIYKEIIEDCEGNI